MLEPYIGILKIILQEFTKGALINILISTLQLREVITKDDRSLIDNCVLDDDKCTTLIRVLNTKSEKEVFQALQRICINQKWLRLLKSIQDHLRSANCLDLIINDRAKNILVIGSTGNGKSTLCNRLITPLNSTTCCAKFPESNNTRSESKETTGLSAVWNGMDIFVIDTPGMNDSDGDETEHLVKMIHYLKMGERLCNGASIKPYLHGAMLPFNVLRARLFQEILNGMEACKRHFNTQQCHKKT